MVFLKDSRQPPVESTLHNHRTCPCRGRPCLTAEQSGWYPLCCWGGSDRQNPGEARWMLSSAAPYTDKSGRQEESIPSNVLPWACLFPKTLGGMLSSSLPAAGTFLVSQLGWGCYGIWWVEARDLLNILQCVGQLPTTKNYLLQYVNSAEVESPLLAVLWIIFHCAK